MITEEIKELVRVMRKDTSKGLEEKAGDLVQVLARCYNVTSEEGQEILEYAFNDVQLEMLHEYYS